MHTPSKDSYGSTSTRYGDKTNGHNDDIGSSSPLENIGAAAVETGSAALQEIQVVAQEVSDGAGELYRETTKALRKTIERQPMAAIGIAAVAGAIISGMIFRR